ncbi:MAG: ComEC/Rec2 family competence protein [Bacteroidales bacterium]|nr:ComEC/Rec2 family competence protein [Bacteroidales bacterium]
MIPLRVRYPAFAAAAASVSAVLIFAGNGLAESLCGIILAIATALLYHRVPAALRVFAGIFCIVTLRAVVLAPAPFSAPEQQWSGVVETLRPSAASQRAVVTLDTPGHLRISLVVTDLTPELVPGDSVTFTAPLCKAGRLLDVPGLRMTDMSDRAERISALATVSPEHIRVRGRSDALYFQFQNLHTRLAEAVYASPLSADAANLLVASTLGAGDAPADIRDSFRSAGISHLLCVSGFHVGVIAGAISLLLFPLKIMRRRWLRALLLLSVVWIYALIVGFTPSVVRAGIMLTAYAVTRNLQRETSAGNALLVALALTLILDPYTLWSAGFQLSFSAVAGILIFSRKLNPVPRRNRFGYRIVEIFTTPVSALLGTLPVSLLWFGRVAVLSIPANAVACILFPLYMLSGIACIILWTLGFNLPWLCKAVDTLSTFITDLVERWADLTESYTPDFMPGIFSIICIVGALIALACALHATHRNHSLGAAMACTLLLLCTGCERPSDERRMLLTGDSFSTHLLVFTPLSSLDLALEGASPCPSHIHSFFGTTDSVPLVKPAADYVELEGAHIFIAGRKTIPASHPEADILFLSGRFKGSPADFIAAMPDATVVLSVSLPSEVQSEIVSVCRQQDRKFVNIASEALFCDFGR